VLIGTPFNAVVFVLLTPGLLPGRLVWLYRGPKSGSSAGMLTIDQLIVPGGASSAI